MTVSLSWLIVRLERVQVLFVILLETWSELDHCWTWLMVLIWFYISICSGDSRMNLAVLLLLPSSITVRVLFRKSSPHWRCKSIRDRRSWQCRWFMKLQIGHLRSTSLSIVKAHEFMYSTALSISLTALSFILDCQLIKWNVHLVTSHCRWKMKGPWCRVCSTRTY